MAHNDYKVLGKGRLNDPIIGHPAMKGRRWMIDYGYESGKTFKKLKDESMEYKDYFSEFETDDTSSNKLQGGVGDATSPSDVNPAELALGVQVEMEHTTDVRYAAEIAMDHLWEDIRYYDKLKEDERWGTTTKVKIKNVIYFEKSFIYIHFHLFCKYCRCTKNKSVFCSTSR